jgi:RecA/RadA recombinase
MKSARVHQLESLLASRQLSGTVGWTWLSERRLGQVPTGSPEMDEGLGGGWPRGEVSEIVGAHSSGRTGLLLTTLGAATRAGEVAGLVDACDGFDPASAEAAGVVLDRVLWVRGEALTAARVDVALQRALRAFDLILRAGGFGLVALDVADVPARVLTAVPIVTWLRLSQANEGRTSAALVVGPAPMGRSARGVSVRLDATAEWAGTSRRSRRFAGFAVRAGVVSGQRRAHETAPRYRLVAAPEV